MNKIIAFSEIYETFKKDFNWFYENTKKELDEAYNSVNVVIEEDNPMVLEMKLEDLSVRYARVEGIKADAGMYLREALSSNLMAKNMKTMTDLDREIKLYDRANFEKTYHEKICGLCKSMINRISVLQSRLKSAREAQGKLTY